MSPELYQQADPEDVGVSSAYLGNIDALQERYLAEDAYQGSVVLVARHGKVCYFKAFGKADDDVPMATDSVFRLASMLPRYALDIPTSSGSACWYSSGLIRRSSPGHR